MTTNRHHQPSRVGQMVRRGLKGRHHHSLSLIRFAGTGKLCGTFMSAVMRSAGDGDVLDDRAKHSFGVHATTLLAAALDYHAVGKRRNREALDVVGHEEVPAVGERL